MNNPCQEEDGPFFKCLFCVYNTPIILSHNFSGTLNISHALNSDTTKSQIASIVKVKKANLKCTGLMWSTLVNPYIHLLP